MDDHRVPPRNPWIVGGKVTFCVAANQNRAEPERYFGPRAGGCLQLEPHSRKLDSIYTDVG
jgi:hypothetical protein